MRAFLFLKSVVVCSCLLVKEVKAFIGLRPDPLLLLVAGDLGLSRDLRLQAGRALPRLRPGLGPAVPDVFPQVRHRDFPDRRDPQSGVSPIFPGRSRVGLSVDVRFGPPAHEEAGWDLDEVAAVVSADLDAGVVAQPGRLHLDGVGRRRRRSSHSHRVRQKVFQKLKFIPFLKDFGLTKKKGREGRGAPSSDRGQCWAWAIKLCKSPLTKVKIVRLRP